jgi:hypothetical protein
MSTPKVMKLVYPYTGRMICQVCGSEHYPSIKPQSGGRFYRGGRGSVAMVPGSISR